MISIPTPKSIEKFIAKASSIEVACYFIGSILITLILLLILLGLSTFSFVVNSNGEQKGFITAHHRESFPIKIEKVFVKTSDQTNDSISFVICDPDNSELLTKVEMLMKGSDPVLIKYRVDQGGSFACTGSIITDIYALE